MPRKVVSQFKSKTHQLLLNFFNIHLNYLKWIFIFIFRVVSPRPTENKELCLSQKGKNLTSGYLGVNKLNKLTPFCVFRSRFGSKPETYKYFTSMISPKVGPHPLLAPDNICPCIPIWNTFKLLRSDSTTFNLLRTTTFYVHVLTSSFILRPFNVYSYSFCFNLQVTFSKFSKCMSSQHRFLWCKLFHR